MKITEGFQAADDRNLSKVDYIMLLEYMQGNECFNIAETRGAKALLASREAYADSAVGYVHVKCTCGTTEHQISITAENINIYKQLVKVREILKWIGRLNVE